MTPQYLLLFRGGDPAAAGIDPNNAMQQWGQWLAQLKAAGQFVHGEPLQGPSGCMLHADGTVTDGPPDAAAAIVSGYMALRAADLNTAQSIARDCPVLAHGGAVEIRPMWVMNGM